MLCLHFTSYFPRETEPVCWLCCALKAIRLKKKLSRTANTQSHFIQGWMQGVMLATHVAIVPSNSDFRLFFACKCSTGHMFAIIAQIEVNSALRAKKKGRPSVGGVLTFFLKLSYPFSF